jgi:hypothetical protein
VVRQDTCVPTANKNEGGLNQEHRYHPQVCPLPTYPCSRRALPRGTQRRTAIGTNKEGRSEEAGKGPTESTPTRLPDQCTGETTTQAGRRNKADMSEGREQTDVVSYQENSKGSPEPKHAVGTKCS